MMIFPLEDLVKYKESMYEVTVAASHRAFQLAKIKDNEVEEYDGKVVSLAARQLFSGEVRYSLENKAK